MKKQINEILEGLSSTSINEGLNITSKLGIRNKQTAMSVLESLLTEWGITEDEVKKLYASKVIALENGKTYTLLKDLFYMPISTYQEFYADSSEFTESFIKKYTKGSNIVFSAGTKVKYYADRGGSNFIIDGVDVPFNALEENLEDSGLTISDMFKR